MSRFLVDNLPRRKAIMARLIIVDLRNVYIPQEQPADDGSAYLPNLKFLLSRAAGFG